MQGSQKTAKASSPSEAPLVARRRRRRKTAKRRRKSSGRRRTRRAVAYRARPKKRRKRRAAKRASPRRKRKRRLTAKHKLAMMLGRMKKHAKRRGIPTDLFESIARGRAGGARTVRGIPPTLILSDMAPTREPSTRAYSRAKTLLSPYY